MHNKTHSSTGSAHVVIIIILIVGLLAALGVTLWKTLSSTDKEPTQATTTSDGELNEAPKKSSEIIPIDNSEFSRYVNYDLGFEFKMPNQIIADATCTETNTYNDGRGNEYIGETRVSSGEAEPTDVSVYKVGDRYVIAPMKVVVYLNHQVTDDGRDIYKQCEIRDTTAELIANEQSMRYGSDIAYFLEYREFEVYKVESEQTMLDKIREIHSDDSATISSITPADHGGKNITFNFVKHRVTGPTFYTYYPDNDLLKIAYVGHSVSFTSPEDPNRYYSQDVFDSFKPLK